MKRTVSLLLLFALLLSALTGCFGTPANSDPGTTAKKTTCESTYETYEKVYVKDLTTDLDFSDNEILLIVQPQFNFTEYTPADFPEADCIDVREIFSVKEGVLGRVLLLTLATHSKQNVIDCIYKLQLRDDIYCVNPNLYDQFLSIPNDTLIEKQWALEKLSLPEAWDVTTGSSTVYVGVIDGGIDNTHPDLVNRVNTSLSRCFTSGFDSPFDDRTGHGTAIAGIIGAQGNNATGIAGVCWDVQLVSLHVGSSPGARTLSASAAIEAIEYADSVGIKILNYSAGSYTHSDELKNAFKQTIENYSGLFVCAAGNDGKDNDKTSLCPCNFGLSNMIVVGASTNTDEIAGTSNYGKTSVDIFAPGSDIYVTQPSNNYGSGDGTSFSAPHVCGVAALLLSKYPTLSPECIKCIIMNNVDIVYSGGNSVFEPYCVSKGRLNAYKTVSATHGNTYQNYDNLQTHKVTCSCGYITYKPHTWKTVTVRPSSGATTQSLVQYKCTKCGYISLVRPTDY